MKQTTSQRNSNLISALLGAIGGGILVIIMMKAIPTMLTKILSAMMEMMKSKMEACGCIPQEVCQKMMVNFAEALKA